MRSLYQCLYGLLASFVLAFFFTDPALALPPVQSHICITIFQALGRGETTASEQIYLSNSLRTFREHQLKGELATPSAGEGLITRNTNTSGFSSKEAAGRVAGIEDFLRSKDAGAEQRFVKTTTIAGREEIEKFIAAFKEALQDNGKTFSKHAFNDFKYSTGINMAVLGNVDWSQLGNGDSKQAAGAVAVTLLQLLWKQDFVWMRPKHWDYSFLSRLDKAAATMGKTDNWALLSKNFDMNKAVVKNLNTTVEADAIADATIVQSYSEALTVRDKLFLKLGPEKLQSKIEDRSWVGIDFFFDKATNGEPELHVVLRGTEERPPFPRTSNQRKKGESQSQEDYQTVPGLAPNAP